MSDYRVRGGISTSDIDVDRTCTHCSLGSFVVRNEFYMPSGSVLTNTKNDRKRDNNNNNNNNNNYYYYYYYYYYHY